MWRKNIIIFLDICLKRALLLFHSPGKCLRKLAGIPQMCGLCPRGSRGAWWLLVDQDRDSANQERPENSPSSLPASPAGPFPLVMRPAESWTQPPASDTNLVQDIRLLHWGLKTFSELTYINDNYFVEKNWQVLNDDFYILDTYQ